MPSLSQVGRIAGLLFGATLGVAGAGAVAALRRPLPRLSGQLHLAGLQAPVQIIRDRWGIPHIYAQNDHDLCFAQGFVHAQDRLWQMEFQRRLGQGKLSEVLGNVALDTDRFIRILGFGRVAQREAELLADEPRNAVEAYCAGVNTFINQNQRRLPVEFTLLRFRPAPWQPADVLSWGKMMALSLSENWRFELLRAQMIATLGPERAAALDPHYPDDFPLTVPPGAQYTPQIGRGALAAAAAVESFAPQGKGQGSNAWVVNGAHSASGKPLLADDPHLGIALPSIWYENHLISPGCHVTGASFVGCPGVVIGHNERIAWGVTNVMADVQDLFIERFDPADPTRYEFQGQWEQAEVVREVITVKGQAAPLIEEVRITRHGPIIDQMVPPAEGKPPTALALRWTALEPGQIVGALLKLNRAGNWDEFRAALADWAVPPQNFVYADVDGHIGYATGGAMPIRAAGTGRLPVPGWDGAHEWIGYIPNDDLPATLDPPEGFVVTANNRIAGDDYPYPFSAEWLNGYRARRIREMLQQKPQHDASSFAWIHVDERSLPGLELAALAGRLPASNPIAKKARAILAAWDGTLSAKSAAGAIYARLREHLVAAAYAEINGPLDVATGLGAFLADSRHDYLLRAAPEVLRRAAARDDAWLPDGQTWDDLLAKAWQQTLAELTAEQGTDVRRWRYGRGHQLLIRHPLGGVPGLGRLLNRGPFERGGDADTVYQQSFSHLAAGTSSFVMPSYRQICDTANWDRSYSIHPNGQSGQPFSPHYDDFVEPWLKGQYHPMLWSQSVIKEAAEHELLLTPVVS